jgi:peptidoglycan/LPS O-acetylase OafA/YrhL
MENQPKLRYIDALRGWAILLIMMAQVGRLVGNDYHWLVENFIFFGDKGIQLFFVISAFTLFHSTNSRLLQGDYSVKSFYLRRFFRIAPMYYLALVYYIWQKGYVCHMQIPTGQIFAGLTFTSGFSPFWIDGIVPGTHTVVVEMMFYALLPLLVLKIKNINQAFRFTFIAYVIAVFLRYFLRLHSPIENEELWRNFLYLNLINQLPNFGIGIIAYFLILKNDRNLSMLNLLILTLLLIGSVIWEFLIPNSYYYSAGFLLLLFILSRNEFACIVNKFTVFIGKISYSVFLIHFAFSFALIKSGLFYVLSDNIYLRFIFSYLLILAATIPFAWLSYRFIETPFRNLGEKIINRMKS